MGGTPLNIHNYMRVRPPSPPACSPTGAGRMPGARMPVAAGAEEQALLVATCSWLPAPHPAPTSTHQHNTAHALVILTRPRSINEER